MPINGLPIRLLSKPVPYKSALCGTLSSPFFTLSLRIKTPKFSSRIFLDENLSRVTSYYEQSRGTTLVNSEYYIIYNNIVSIRHSQIARYSGHLRVDCLLCRWPSRGVCLAHSVRCDTHPLWPPTRRLSYHLVTNIARANRLAETKK